MLYWSFPKIIRSSKVNPQLFCQCLLILIFFVRFHYSPSKIDFFDRLIVIVLFISHQSKTSVYIARHQYTPVRPVTGERGGGGMHMLGY